MPQWTLAMPTRLSSLFHTRSAWREASSASSASPAEACSCTRFVSAVPRSWSLPRDRAPARIRRNCSMARVGWSASMRTMPSRKRHFRVSSAHLELLEALDQERHELEDLLELTRFDAQGKSLVRQARRVRDRVHRVAEPCLGLVEPAPRFLASGDKAARRSGDEGRFAQEEFPLVENSDRPPRLLQESVEEVGVLDNFRRRRLELVSQESAHSQKRLRLLQAQLQSPRGPPPPRSCEDVSRGLDPPPPRRSASSETQNAPGQLGAPLEMLGELGGEVSRLSRQRASQGLVGFPSLVLPDLQGTAVLARREEEGKGERANGSLGNPLRRAKRWNHIVSSPSASRASLSLNGNTPGTPNGSRAGPASAGHRLRRLGSYSLSRDGTSVAHLGSSCRRQSATFPRSAPS